MVFENLTLSPPMADYVESVFYFKDFVPDHSIERVVPNGHSFILMELDGFLRYTYENTNLQALATFEHVWISGMHKDHISISAHEASEMMVIQFKAYGAYPFLHVPVDRLNNQVVSTEDLFGQELLELREEVLKHTSVADKFAQVETYLLRRFDPSKVPSEDLMNSINQLKNQAYSDYSQVLESYPKTQKHLISQSKKYCGLTPKILHRIYRFNTILQQIHTQKQISWAQIAYEFGYTDQSHFIKEFREFSGFNPSEFLEMAFDEQEPNFFPLDREG